MGKHGPIGDIRHDGVAPSSSGMSQDISATIPQTLAERKVCYTAVSTYPNKFDKSIVGKSEAKLKPASGDPGMSVNCLPDEGRAARVVPDGPPVHVASADLESESWPADAALLALDRPPPPGAHEGSRPAHTYFRNLVWKRDLDAEQPLPFADVAPSTSSFLVYIIGFRYTL